MRTLAIPAVALASTEPDPIFAAIEANRHAWTENERQCSQLDEAAEDGQAECKLQWLDEALDAIAEALVDIVPTTFGGIAALLDEHAIDRGDRWPGEYFLEDANGRKYHVYWGTVLHVHLAEALSKVAVSGTIRSPEGRPRSRPIRRVSGSHLLKRQGHAPKKGEIIETANAGK